MSRLIITSGQNNWQPRHRTQARRDNAGSFEDAMQFRRGSMGALLFLGCVMVAAVLS